MPLVPRLFAGDVELGKRDDDHRPGSKSQFGLTWQQRRIAQTPPQRRNMKRLVLGILVVIGLYFFFKNMPTDLENPRSRPYYGPAAGPDVPSTHSQDIVLKAEHKDTSDGPQHDFNGPIKFYELASSLRALTKLDHQTGNVLFTAASLKSAAILLPIACAMATRERNTVHFALMGRDLIAMDILQSVNGISQECKITFHDARPDFPVQSSEFRMEVSSAAALSHINTFVHPQAILIDGSGEEEPWFLRGIKDRAVSLGRTVIELPDNAEQNLMWITLLDSSSLSAWNRVTVDIIVHAQPAASGSLIRLLQSLKKADFFSSTLPRLTIELPHKIDEPSSRYLAEQFHWPPVTSPNTGSLLTLHHRIPQHGLTSEENSIRLLESFWPADPYTNHVLVLTPQVELSPLFFHYLKYTMLEYMYSADAGDRSNLLGISLDLPSAYLNDSAKFAAPMAKGSREGKTEVTPFLWQAPNSNAVLYFGDKWVEMHDFVSQSLTSLHTLPPPTTLDKKLVSETYPSWLEHVLRLARARGYWTMYPNFDNEYTIATLHNELYQAPEEYSEETQATAETSGELTADPKDHVSLKHRETPLIETSLLSVLPLRGELPKLSSMPLLAWDGDTTNTENILQLATEYSNVFKKEIGGCAEASAKERVERSAGDLFCLNDPKTQEPDAGAAVA
ncbi:hypothetical protein B2J93_982 [Marssonina coronariae]|uniref:Glycosyltransferase 2 n=1 Tax=Diplocarpon coronariae TaxID=2795749 RepID=A0A218ZDP2_9HELO|nr:hypothetical protein B2J93_982 [Marssonina coronariae]